MVTALYVIAFVMVLGGVSVLVRGAPFLGVDWGSTLILAGTIGASSGAILAGIAAVAGRLKRLHGELVAMRDERASHLAEPPAEVSVSSPVLGREAAPEPAGAGDRAPASLGDAVPPTPSRAAGRTLPLPEPDDSSAGALAASARLGTDLDPPAAEPPRRPSLAALAEIRPEPAARVPDFLTRSRAEPPPPDPFPELDRPDLAEPAPTSLPGEDADRPVRPRAPVFEPHRSEARRHEPVASTSPRGPSFDRAARLPPAPPLVTPAASASFSAPPAAPSASPAPVEAVAAADSALPAAEAAAPAPEPVQEGAQPAVEIGRYASGGNSYVMFSDGSIEAETPNGRFRFDSLDQLKHFIASGGERPASATA